MEAQDRSVDLGCLLWDRLRNVLSQREFDLAIAVYHLGLRPVDVARATERRPGTIRMALGRVRQKARRALSTEWAGI